MNARLIKAMDEAGHTSRTLARKIDVSEDYINKLKNGERNPSLRTAIAIGQALGLPGPQAIEIFLPENVTNSRRQEAQ
jgi:DNA-binding XRE family transcriptional regulator